MTTISATNFRKNMYEILNDTAKYNDIVTIPTKEGNVIILSDDDYRGLMETVYICSQPEVLEKIMKADAEPIEECVPADEVDW